ncbi:pyruvate synthase subunit PorB [Endomicrobiia bacterium]|nr:pyruvate synthase subunit PorB [Endomicrobiia bacterium]GHT65382.1 pyruvate synthase subunit PorB [Endomicrobiia bacterium]GHT70801.1 pyruvate synthase subunit PorB [Endomicrobiia bacterium]
MANLKDLSKNPERVTGGHRLCAGCGAGIVARQTLIAVGDAPVVVTSATGCLEVSTTIFPYTSWKNSFFHSAFENSAATCSGIEAAYKSLKKQGKITEDIKFIAFGGDGGTYDIGLQSLSGAMERWHKMLYICYNNEAYMNTGIQRSGATPKGTHTTTAPAGKVQQGKEQNKKDLTQIMIAHDIPYVAQAYVGNWNDFITKVQKALSIDGPSFINILTPCRLGWNYKPEDTMTLARIAVETCIWPSFEVENGVYKINVMPKEKKPVVEFLKPQGRFKHLFKPENAHILESIQKNVDTKWEILQRRASVAYQA